ncbi:MAG: hypothetical protein KDH88_04900 [Chromatiales bacterium]|nr:hypothetical protein [Chromatiales bacterium]
MIVSARYRTSGSWADAEGESLQTDVMRFMAILGLCLTAIFALVQSMSLRPVDRLEIDRLTTELTAERDSHRNARQTLAAQRQEIGRLETVNAALRKTLAELQPPQSPGQPVETSQAVPPREPAEPRAEIEPEPKSEAEPLPAAPSEPATEEHEGFALRFSSADALGRLVRRDAVKFYALVGGRAWRLVGRGASWTYRSAQAPKQVHDMEPATVPEPMRQAFQAHSGNEEANENIRWGVILSASIHDALQRQMSKVKGGTISIDGDGRVELGGTR